MDALVEVHAVDWRACGLEGYGKPTGYLDRQLRRFGGLWEHNRTRELPVLDRSPPGSPSTSPTRARRRSCTATTGSATRCSRRARRRGSLAIFDWELATIGDPLADVGYLVATWAQPGDPDARCSALAPSRAGRASRRASELIARYEERSGRSMSDVRWYVTLALWKSAMFLEGSYKRRLAGTTEDAFFRPARAAGVPRMAERGGAARA